MNSNLRQQSERWSLDYIAKKVEERGLIWAIRRALQLLLHLFATVVAFLPGVLLSSLGIRIISSCPERIGEFGIRSDIYVKMGFLGWRPSFRTTMLVHPREIVNRCYTGYWRRYIHMICNPVIVHLLRPLPASKHLFYDTAFFILPNGKTVRKDLALVAVQKKWETENRAPLLILSSLDHERGWRCLQEFGVPKGAPFVCMHVREPGFLREANDPYHAYRNADVDTYLLAVRSIVSRGWWVIRMGDPTTKPIQQSKHVIDYAHSDAQSDWMDIFCCAQCRFFLGTSSGLFVVSFTFGVPCALSNYTPMTQHPPSQKDIFIPKLYWSLAEQRYLTFEEGFVPPLSHCYDGRIFSSLGIQVVDNTPEEINDLTLEMLDRLDGLAHYTQEDAERQERYHSLATYESYGVSSRVGRAFLSKYSYLLPPHGMCQ